MQQCRSSIARSIRRVVRRNLSRHPPPTIVGRFQCIEKRAPFSGCSFSSHARPSDQQSFDPTRNKNNTNGVNEIWKRKTLRLLNEEVGTWTDRDWHEAEMAFFQFWTRQKGDVETTWELLDRVVEEARNSEMNSTSSNKNRLAQQDWLNRAVDAWRLSETTTSLDPSQVLDKILNQYFPLLRPDARTLSMLVQATTERADDPAQAPFLAERILENITERLSEEGESAASSVIDAISMASIMNSWAKSGLPEAPYKVQALLDTMQDVHQIPPETIHYNILLNAYAKSEESAERAYELLQYMEQLQEKGNSERVKPDEQSYGTVVAAFAKTGQSQRAEQVLRRLMDRYRNSPGGDPDLLPSAIGFSSLMDALAKSGQADAAEHAETILEWMYDVAERSGKDEMRPNVICHNAVLNAWSKSSRKDAPQRAEALLRDMMESYHRDGSVKPDKMSFTAVLDCLARTGSAERAEAILQQMIDLSELTKDATLFPDTVSFSSVLNAWAKSGEPNAPQRAEAILQRMQELHESGVHNDVKPNVVSFSTVADCWAKSKQKGSAERAEAILHWMHDLYDAGNEHSLPNTYTYNAVMDAFSRSRARGAPERAEAILDQMKQNGLTPNRFSYTTLITAWSRSGRKDAPLKAEALLEELKSLHAAGKPDCKPSFVTYSALINAWTSSGHPDAAERAVALLDEMEQSRLKPNKVCCNAIIKLYATKGNPEQAEAILNYMDEQYHNGGNRYIKPDVVSYTTVLRAWTRCSKVGAIRGAEAVLQRMLDLSAAGDSSVRPNLVTYTTLLSAIARSKDANKGVCAEGYLKQMKSMYAAGHRDCKPSTIPYSLVITAWANSRRPEGGKRALAWLEEMKDSGDPDVAPDALTYQAVRKAVLNSDMPDRGQIARMLNEKARR